MQPRGCSLSFLIEMNQCYFQLLQTHEHKISVSILLDIQIYTHLSDSHLHLFDPLSANKRIAPPG